MSYRRDDTAGHAGRLSSDLERLLGAHTVFRDIEDISPGRDFRTAIARELESATVVLVLIGQRWLAIDSGPNRLMDENDLVRIEVSTALRSHGDNVIPVLVHGAKLPSEDQLPPDVQPIVRHQAIELSESRWDFDVDRLAAQLAAPTRKKPFRSSPNGTSSRSTVRAIGVLIALLVMGAGIWYWTASGDGSQGDSDEETTPGTDAPVDETTSNAAPSPLRKLSQDELTVTATSTLGSVPGCGGTCYFIPANAHDGDSATAWSEGVDGLGQGETLQFNFGVEQRVVRVDLLPGWQRGETCLFQRNGRPRELLLRFDSGASQTVAVPDEATLLQIPVDALTSSMVIQILEVWPGSDCGGQEPDEDTLITEVSIFVT